MMEAVQFDPQDRKLSLIKAPLPTEPKKNEVVVRVAYSGICGTDLHIVEVQNWLKGNFFTHKSGAVFLALSIL
jgi:threonine dehydrogenase-like Zn-dependent dehydrogenase